MVKSKMFLSYSTTMIVHHREEILRYKNRKNDRWKCYMNRY